jgi:glycerophosphoryl diester phosphodiesterase
MNPVYIVLIVVGALLLLAASLYLFAIKPRRKRKEMDKFRTWRYAHRGLHNDQGAENSMTAFENAIKKGYGIEIDVRYSKDGELVVFHDETLKRVCGIDKRVVDLTVSELKEIRLGNTEDTIPTFKEFLEFIDGRVPLLIEIKQDQGEGNVAFGACQMLKGYKGDYMLQSFNPLAIKTVKRELPHAVRGILSDNYMRDEKRRGMLYKLLKNLMFNFLCRPDFIAFNHEEIQNSFTVRFVKKLFNPTLFAWTVRSADDEKSAYNKGFDVIIFENFEA